MGKRRFLVKSICILISMFVAVNIYAGEQDICKRVDMKFLKSHINLPVSKIESKKEINGMCEIIVNYNQQFIPLYVDNTKKFVIFGKMHSNQNQITKKSIEAIKKKYSKKRELKFVNVRDKFDSIVNFTHKPENSSGEELYFITDPNCGYCKKAGQKINKLTDPFGITVKTIIVSTMRGSKEKAIEALKNCTKAADTQSKQPGSRIAHRSRG